MSDALFSNYFEDLLLARHCLSA